MTDIKNTYYTSINTKEYSWAQPNTSSPSTPDIITGTVLSIDKNGKLISRKAISVNGVIKYLSDGEVEKLCDRLPKELQIRSIAYSEVKGKEKVIVVFQDGTKVIKHLLEGDHFDLNIGVALAFMEKLYGTKSQYHKMIQKKVQKPKVKKEAQKQADTK